MNKINSVLLTLSLLVYGIPMLPVNLPMVNAEEAYPPQIGEFETSSNYVVPDNIFSLRCIVSDQNGKDTIVNASLELSQGVILLWRNDTNSFSLYQNLHGFARLESGSFSRRVNSTTYKLNFHLSYYVNMTEGFVSVLSSGTRVYDNSSLCGYGNYSSLFTFGFEPEAWQTNPSRIPSSGHALGFEEAVVILIISLVIIAVSALFSKRGKSTQEKYHEMIDVRPKERK